MTDSSDSFYPTLGTTALFCLLLLAPSFTTIPADAQETVAHWVIDSQPTLVLGQLDGPEEGIFHHVVDATRLSDGTIIVGLGTRGRFELRYFRQGGEHLVSAGRWGEGPFEHSSRWSMERLADSVLIVSVAHRFSVFGPRGEEVREGRFDVTGPLMVRGMVDDRYLVLWRERSAPPQATAAGTAAYEVHLHYFDMQTGGIQRAATLPSGRGKLAANGLILRFPFEPTAYWDTGAGALWLGYSREGAVRRVSPSDPPATVPLPHPPQRVTESDREAWRHSDLGSATGAMLRTRRNHHRGLDFPEVFPWFQDIHVDTSGNAWVLRYEPYASRVDYVWDVFDPVGAHIAVATMPFELLGAELRNYRRTAVHAIKEIGPDYVLVIIKDDLGVERLALLSISR